MRLVEALEEVERAIGDFRRAALAAHPEALEIAIEEVAHASAVLRSAARTERRALDGDERERSLAIQAAIFATRPYLDHHLEPMEGEPAPEPEGLREPEGVPR